MHLVYAKAVALREVMAESFREYAQQVLINARALARELLARGRPILTGTTCNHMVLMDVTKRLVHIGEPVDGMYDVDLVPTDLTGKSAEKILEVVGISVNKNMLPNDERTPLDPSGLRLGTPALTTRGMGEVEVKEIAEIIDEALR